ncbi:MAG: hypothetical protein Q8O92_10965 [Candidatus Latescibacter sp.]|nr:hypothetical protein [Candidatus Latescibacter sp.]
MHKPFAVFIFCIILFLISACSSDKTTSSIIYTDSLVLGIGISGWNIVGESSTFINNPAESGITIYYRIESKDDLKGSNLEFDIYRNTSSGFELIHIIPIINTYYTAHILVGSFIHTWGAGSFKASIRLINTNQVIGVKEFTVVNK